MAWLDGPPEPVRCLADVLRSGRRAVVSLTDVCDTVTRPDLAELVDVLDDTTQVEIICVTAGWFDKDRDPPVEMRIMRLLAAAPALSLGLVCSHVTGLVRVRGTSVCWDYRCGTPHFIASVKTRTDTYVLPQHHLIGTADWLARAKATRSLPPDMTWEDFIGGPSTA